MFRTLILFLLFYMIYRLIKKIVATKSQPQHTGQKPSENKKIEGEKILPCENCKVYFPESEKIERKGLNFCSEKCVKEYFEKIK